MSSLQNQGNVADFLSGDAHVLYAAIGVAGLGTVLVAWGWKGSNRSLLIVGILLIVLGVGIAVDLWAHSFTH